MRLMLLTLDPSEPPAASRSLGQLEVICNKHQLEIVPVSNMAGLSPDMFDMLVVVGEIRDTTASKAGWYQPVVSIIGHGNKPVLGIGLGFEMVCAAFDTPLIDRGEVAMAPPVITPTEDGAKLFQGTDPLRVAEIPRWLVAAADLPKSLQVLATSATTVEALRHKTQPVFGLQLYPEDFVYPSDGKLVFENILAAMQKAVLSK